MEKRQRTNHAPPVKAEALMALTKETALAMKVELIARAVSVL